VQRPAIFVVVVSPIGIEAARLAKGGDHARREPVGWRRPVEAVA
jgi:hypothetical protein